MVLCYSSSDRLKTPVRFDQRNIDPGKRGGEKRVYFFLTPTLFFSSGKSLNDPGPVTQLYLQG